MAHPTTYPAHHAGEAIKSLGMLLAELTADRPAATVHAVIVDRLDDTASARDHRIEGVLADGARFEAMWTLLRAGVAPSASAWQTVVLPAILVFGNESNVKAHLELATSLWRAAQAAVDEPEATPTDAPIAGPGYGIERVQPSIMPEFVAERKAPALPANRRTRRWRRALWPVVVAATLLAAGTVFSSGVLTDNGRPSQADAPARLSGSGEATTPAPSRTADSILPTGTAAAQALPAVATPAPSPAWSGSGPITAPSPPRGLASTRVTGTAVSLTWRAPTDAGTGGLAYYRILRDSVNAGWTKQTSAMVTGLAPGQSYTFVIVAYNAAGAVSAGSNAVTVTTPAPSQAPSPTPNPDSSPAPTPRPSATPVQAPTESPSHPSSPSPSPLPTTEPDPLTLSEPS